MRYLQVIEAPDVHAARNAYLALVQKKGFVLDATMTVYVETIHRDQLSGGSWLCYIAPAMQHAA